MKKIYRFILCTVMCISVIFTCSALISAAPKVAKVMNVKVSSVAANKVTLKWKKASGVTGYRVYRYNASKEKYVYVGKTKKLSYTDPSLSAGKVYKYKVRAYKTKNKKNTYGAYSDAVKAVTAPKKVTGLRTTYVGTGNVKLTWKKTKGATGYEIFLYDFKKKAYVSKGVVTQNSCVLKKLSSNTQYRVKIAAFHNKNGKISGLKSAALNFRTAIPGVSGLKVTDVTESSYTLKWNAVSGCDGYQVYRYENSVGWKNVKNTATASYTVKNLPSGNAAVYRVRAYKKNGSNYNYGGYSSQVTANTLPGAPTDLSAVIVNQVIALKWESHGAATGYEISRFNVSRNAWEVIGKTTYDTYTDDTLTQTGTYTYRVRAYVGENVDFATAYTASVSIFFESSYVPDSPYGESTMAAAGVLGFLYDPYANCFYTASDPWQRVIGYNELFDIFAPGIAISFDTARVKFDYGNKNWMLQFWKGQYGFAFYGAEIGIYTKPKDRALDHYNCASDDEKLMMSMDLYNSGVHKFSRPYGSYWWCTGFIPGNILGAYHNLRVYARVTMKDYDMLLAVKRALDSDEVSGEGIIYDINGLNIYISYQ